MFARPVQAVAFLRAFGQRPRQFLTQQVEIHDGCGFAVRVPAFADAVGEEGGDFRQRAVVVSRHQPMLPGRQAGLFIAPLGAARRVFEDDALGGEFGADGIGTGVVFRRFGSVAFGNAGGNRRFVGYLKRETMNHLL